MNQYPQPQHPFAARQVSLPAGSLQRPALERAVESMQAHLAALTERIDALESPHRRSSSSLVSIGGSSSRSPARWAGGRSPEPRGWDIDDMGMWSLVLAPLARVYARARRLMDFVLYNENRSPTLVVIRRLFLDISFLLCVLAVVKMAWMRSGVRRREVLDALKGVWYAFFGRRRPRMLVDRAV